MRSFLPIFILVSILALIRYVLGLHHAGYGIDDANIYYVYVKNLANGHGFVYTPGGERVEGFTSLLWPLVMYVVYMVKFLPFERTLLLICLIITTLTVRLFYLFFRKMFQRREEAFLGAGMILLIPGFIDWNVFALMDISLWIYAITAATFILIDKEMNRGKEINFLWLVFILPLVRPEGMAFAFILAVLWIMRFKWLNVHDRAPVNFVYLPVMIAAISVAAITLFRLWYFGYPVPNTFYAKVSMSVTDNIKQAFYYLYDSLRHTTVLAFLLLGVALILFFKDKYLLKWKRNWHFFFLLAIILFFTAYPFLSGGDHFKYSRFFQPVYPLIILFFLLVSHTRITALKKPVRLLVWGVLLVGINLNSINKASFQQDGVGRTIAGYLRGIRPDMLYPSQLQSEFDIGYNGRNLGGYLNTLFAVCDSMPSYGVTAAGGIAYVYKGRVVDVLGLNNPEMAHADKIKRHGVKNHGSFSKRVFNKQRPDIFLTWPDPLADELVQTRQSAQLFYDELKKPDYFINMICDNIFNDPDFISSYRFCELSNGKDYVFGFVEPQIFRSRFPEIEVNPLQ